MTKILKAEDECENVEYVDYREGALSGYYNDVRIDKYLVATLIDIREFVKLTTMLVDDKDGNEPHFVTWMIFNDDHEEFMLACEWHVIDGRAIMQMTDKFHEKYKEYRIDCICRWEDADNYKKNAMTPHDEFQAMVNSA